MIIPSIDLINGKLVQLKQGKDKIIELDNPVYFAKKYAGIFDIQVIDLDAAFDKGDNLELIRRICKIAKCRVGGGIRSLEKAKQLIDSGADKLIIGTKANKEFLEKLVDLIGKDKIIVAIDAKNRKVSVNGWTKETGKDIFEIVKELENYCSEFLYTCIDKEGLMSGGDIETVKELKILTKNKISFAGGISEISEIKEFDKICVDCVVGMAIYSGKINPEEALVESLDFLKVNLIPTIVKDVQGNVLMLAYSSKESLAKTLETRTCWYFSRSRNKLWLKGETSGNTQELIEIKTDCDKDSLLFIIKQKGNACHLNRYSCFEEKKMFDFQALFNKIKERIGNSEELSYTKKLSLNENYLKRKIVEESAELITSSDKEEMIKESADLIYFIFVFLAKNNISLQDIEKENSRRDGK